jgi:hypothetical protein
MVLELEMVPESKMVLELEAALKETANNRPVTGRRTYGKRPFPGGFAPCFDRRETGWKPVCAETGCFVPIDAG